MLLRLISGREHVGSVREGWKTGSLSITWASFNLVFNSSFVSVFCMYC